MGIDAWLREKGFVQEQLIEEQKATLSVAFDAQKKPAQPKPRSPWKLIPFRKLIPPVPKG
jgi:hypothetical protein